MHPQLQDSEHGPSGLFRDPFQAVEVPWIDDQGLFADDIRLVPERQPYVRVMKVVRGTDRNPVYPVLVRAPPELVHVPVEPFYLPEEPRFEGITVQHPYGVVGVGRRHETVPGVGYGLEMPRSDVSRRPYHGEVAAHEFLLSVRNQPGV